MWQRCYCGDGGECPLWTGIPMREAVRRLAFVVLLLGEATATRGPREGIWHGIAKRWSGWVNEYACYRQFIAEAMDLVVGCIVVAGHGIRAFGTRASTGAVCATPAPANNF